jgi:hypothetical protein
VFRYNFPIVDEGREKSDGEDEDKAKADTDDSKIDACHILIYLTPHSTVTKILDMVGIIALKDYIKHNSRSECDSEIIYISLQSIVELRNLRPGLLHLRFLFL